jgi:hypothetical protein
MTRYEKLRDLVIGAPLDPLSQRPASTSRWRISRPGGLGADGLSSSAYGPEARFRARRAPHLGLFPRSPPRPVFIISLAYNQVTRTNTGGGGYRVATSLTDRAQGCVEVRC